MSFLTMRQWRNTLMANQTLNKVAQEAKQRGVDLQSEPETDNHCEKCQQTIVMPHKCDLACPGVSI